LPVRAMSGSTQRDDSIGSRVNETNSETSTAKATVMPKAKKKRPMMPLMKATGMKTAMTEKVVASTASPISLVPSRAAVTWSSPCSRCRTMFSRTTIASSISSPMASDSAISVIMFKVMPANRITMNAEITEIGRVSPVMTVDRQELRKMNTMKTVSSPPMMSVSWTSATDSRMKIDPSRTTSIVVPAGSSV
jgi:hypothetical protein